MIIRHLYKNNAYAIISVTILQARGSVVLTLGDRAASRHDAAVDVPGVNPTADAIVHTTYTKISAVGRVILPYMIA